MTLENQINKRYGELAEGDCCLSCGGALSHGEAHPGEVCVDLGSGRGNDALRIAQTVGDSGFVYGIDIADKMIEKARATAKKLGIENVMFKRSPLERIDLPGECAHLVISNCTINHARDKQAVWNEIYRILKKGGRFAVSDIYALEEVPENFRNDPAAVAECWAGAVTKSVYRETISNAGFSNIAIVEESKPYTKGMITVASFTVTGIKPAGCCCGR